MVNIWDAYYIHVQKHNKHDIYVYVKWNYFYGSPHIQIVNGRGGANHVETWSSI
jgi:hypothetical protein